MTNWSICSSTTQSHNSSTPQIFFLYTPSCITHHVLWGNILSKHFTFLQGFYHIPSSTLNTTNEAMYLPMSQFTLLMEHITNTKLQYCQVFITSILSAINNENWCKLMLTWSYIKTDGCWFWTRSYSTLYGSVWFGRQQCICPFNVIPCV